ncbi:oligosaccharide flippase family protein [Enterococcus cecorum]|uniref:oligosaccharide flippase family protein n=1 Tax=Enterococcus cecorum TaxID=44008 RepID=UPI002AC9FE1B|nr:oligosaccharide flippase family protein [Enterococcus cecorum]MDZ5583429.1 oligosaccharide flippase family protein [Enterococcus cecorum]
MSRERNLVKNTAILAIGQLSSKVFTFLLLPVYTSLLTPNDFGKIDAVQTVISLLLYFVTLQIENAIFRFLIEYRNKENIQISYVTSASVVLLVMVGISITLIILLNYIFMFPYIKLIIALILIQSLYLFISNLARGLGKNVDYSIASFLITVSSLISNILMIVIFKYGAVSILLSIVISNLIGFIYLFYRVKIWKLIKFENIDIIKINEMLRYSLPLIPNAISWWIANMSDRLIVIYFLGTMYNGIYAAANKIPTIYTTIFVVFNTAWAESVSLAINDSDRNNYIESMMNNSFKLFSFINMGIILCVSIFFDYLIGNQYSEAYNQIFILLLAVFVNSLCSLLGGILGGLKNTYVIGWTTVIGAIINAIINIIFIKIIGLYAASISTLISYIIIYLFRHFSVRKTVPYKISRSYLISYFLMLVLVSYGYFERKFFVNMIILFILLTWGFFQNRKILYSLINSIKYRVMH